MSDIAREDLIDLAVIASAITEIGQAFSNIVSRAEQAQQPRKEPRPSRFTDYGDRYEQHNIDCRQGLLIDEYRAREDQGRVRWIGDGALRAFAYANGFEGKGDGGGVGGLFKKDEQRNDTGIFAWAPGHEKDHKYVVLTAHGEQRYNEIIERGYYTPKGHAA